MTHWNAVEVTFRSRPQDLMIKLYTLGRTDIDGLEPEPLQKVLAQPKRLALLAYLTLQARSGYSSRESLLVLFWPELDLSHARDALRQSLRYLRKSLGSEAIVGHGRDRVGVDPDRVHCDAWEFEQLLDEGQAEAALTLYRGPLLAGLDGAIADIPEFERWLSVERARLHRRAVTAAWDLAEDARDAGDSLAAVREAHRAAQLAPDSEEGVRRLIGILAWSGNIVAAVRAYDEYAEHIREHFEIEPSKATKDLITRIRATHVPVPVTGTPLHTVDADSLSKEEVSPRALHAEMHGPPRTASSLPLKMPQPGEREPNRIPARRRWRSREAFLALLVLGVLVATGLTYQSTRHPSTPLSSAGSVAIFPFRVGGADPSLGWMREGMVDLLSAEYTGEVGPRALVTRTVLHAWNKAADSGDLPADQMAHLARSLGAGHFLTGTVVGDRQSVVIHASLHSVAGGRVLRAKVRGPVERVHSIAGSLANHLIALEAGEPARRVPALQGVPPEAVRAYLRGQQLYRAAAHERADRQFEAALQIDSTFALAALGLVQTRLTAPWIRGHVFTSAIPIAWRLRAQLGPADRRFIAAVAGPNFPLFSSGVDALDAWDQAVGEAPSSPEAWYQYGDALFHWGNPLGVPDYERRARRAFERALQLDSTFTLPLAHLIDLAATEEDAVRLARYGRWYLRHHADADQADYVRWRVATAAGDQASLRDLRGRIGRMSFESLLAILKAAQLDPRFISDGLQVGRVLADRAQTPSERWQASHYLHALALNRGDPEGAVRFTLLMAQNTSWPRHHLRTRISDALFWGGDRRAAEHAVRALGPSLDASERAAGAESQAWFADVCTVEVWKLWHRDVATARRSIEHLQSSAAAGEDSGAVAERRNCAALLQMLYARAAAPAELQTAVERFSLLFDVAAPLPSPIGGDNSVTLLLARILEEQGDPAGALRVLQRPRTPPVQLAPLLNEQGRLAAQVGDTTQAIQAYRRYLALRSDPRSPGLRAEAEQARRMLEALMRGERDDSRARAR